MFRTKTYISEIRSLKPYDSPAHKFSQIKQCNGPGPGKGGVLGPKITGGVPWATENWTQKDLGENGILGPKRSILWGFVPKRSFLCWWMRKNTPKRSSLVPRGSKKGVKTAAHMYHPSYREYPPPPPGVMGSVIVNAYQQISYTWHKTISAHSASSNQ